MKTISRVFCVTLLMASFFACKKSDGPAPQLSVSRSTISLGLFQGFTDSFDIQSGAAWELELSPASATQWMQLSVTRGVAGKTVVKVSATVVNTTTQTATIIIKPVGRPGPKVEVKAIQKIYATDWNKIAGGNNLDEIRSMVRTPDGGIVIAGTTLTDGDGDFPDSHGYRDGFVMKLTATGTIAWSKTFGGDGDEEFNSIAVTPAGDLIACGVSTSSNNGDIPTGHGYFDVWVVKLDASGTKIWSRVYGGTGLDDSGCVAIAPDGGIVVVGETNSNNSDDVGATRGGSDLWVLKLNQEGNILWNKLLGGNDSEYGMKVICTTDGSSIIAAGSFSNNNGDVGPNHGEMDAWVLKLNAAGQVVWKQTFGGSQDDEIYHMTPAPDNGVVFTGYTKSNDGDIDVNKGQADAWILKIDATGNKVWSRTYGGYRWDEMSGVAVTPEGDLLLSGSSVSDDDGDVGPNNGDWDMWVLKLNSMGGKIWSKMMGGENSDQGSSILSLGNGEFVTGATTNSDGTGDVGAARGYGDIWLVKFK